MKKNLMLLLGVATVPVIMAPAFAGEWQIDENTYGTVTTAGAVGSGAGGTGGTGHDTYLEDFSAAKFKWVTDDIVADPAPYALMTHKMSYSSTLAASRTGAGTGRATVDIEGLSAYQFYKQRSGENGDADQPISGSPVYETNNEALTATQGNDGKYYIAVAASVSAIDTVQAETWDVGGAASATAGPTTVTTLLFSLGPYG